MGGMQAESERVGMAKKLVIIEHFALDLSFSAYYLLLSVDADVSPAGQEGAEILSCKSGSAELCDSHKQ